MEQEIPPVKRKRATKSPEFLAMRAKAQGFQSYLREKDKIDNPHLYVKDPYVRGHGMKKDRNKHWAVGVFNSTTKKHEWLTTEEDDIEDALQVIDDIGSPNLSEMARDGTGKFPIIQTGENMLAKFAFEAWIKEVGVGRSASTTSCYVSAVRNFIFKGGFANKKLSTIKRNDIHAFINSGDYKESTRELWRVAIKMFFNFCYALGATKANAAADLRINKSRLTNEQRERTPAVPFTDEEYRVIMAKEGLPPFWRYGTALSYWLGLREVDICRFEWSSIGEDFVVLYPQKTGRKLILPLNNPMIGSGELKAIFDEMKKTLNTGSLYCFPYAQSHYPGQPFKNFIFYSTVLRKCGLDTSKTFNGWRHTFKLRLEKAGLPIETISQLMGHANIGVTQGYGRHVYRPNPYLMGTPASLQPPAAATAPSPVLDWLEPAAC